MAPPKELQDALQRAAKKQVSGKRPSYFDPPKMPGQQGKPKAPKKSTMVGGKPGC